MTKPAWLQRRLGLLDVYVISVGAMFSSGFFLLPGIAASYTGSSVVLAYLIAGLLMIPALLSKVELATAMPKAGGVYYYLDRTLGPLVGVAAGLGTWLTLMLKSAFALVGMGAYLAVVFDVPIKPVAVGFTALFALLNLVGFRESSALLRVLVFTLFSVLGLFVLHGAVDILQRGVGTVHRDAFTPFLSDGIDGLLATVGLVFISFVGLTKVTSVAEQVEDPERNLPLGMTLSLLTVMGIYGAGVYVMVGVLGVPRLSESLTPVADAARAFAAWIPADWAVWLVVLAAAAAFTSMANAGIMAASRYPLAMARDRLIPERFASVNKRGMPVAAILLSATMIAVFAVVLDITDVAKIASALQLLLFGLLNLAVVVMRESQIESYDPGFRSPLYPWTQVVGLIVPFVLVAQMGWLPGLFAVSVAALSIVWYVKYARARIAREGAIFHVFARLGRRRFAGLDRELRDIMKEKGARAEDPFDEVVARAAVIDAEDGPVLSDVVHRSAALLTEMLPGSTEDLNDTLLRDIQAGGTPPVRGVLLIHGRLADADVCELVLVRCGRPASIDVGGERFRRRAVDDPVQAMFVLVSGDTNPGRHLRILAQLAARMEDEGFLQEWLDADGEPGLKETLLRDDRYLAITLTNGSSAGELIGKALRDLQFPEGCLVALVRRYGVTMVPRGRTVLRESDRLTVIGDPAGLRNIEAQYGTGRKPG